MIRRLFAPLFFLALTTVVLAATPPSPAPVSVLSDSLVLPVTASSSRLALPSTAASAYAVTICNTGAKDGYFALGSVTVNATTAHNLVRAGSGVALFSNGAAYIAGIAGGSDTTTFTIYQGNGPLAQCPASAGSGGGGAITGNVGILNSGSTQIDPATAQRQDTGNTSLGTIATNTTGAATAANQSTANGSLSTIATNTTGAATAVNQTAPQANAGSDATKAVAVQGVTGGKAVKVDGSAVTQPVSAALLPLPANAAQETGGNLATIAGAVTSSVVQSNTKQVNGVTTQTGAGAAGTGSQRVAVAQDATTVAGSAPGTAGTPSTNVLTVQGATSMTKLLVTPDSVALPANQSVNVAQINGAAPSLTNPVFTANAEAADVSGTFTNGTQTNSVTNTSADGYAAGLISINGTYGTASGVFEASDDAGTTWYSIVCGRSDGTASETGYTALTNVTRQWSCPVGGNDSIRIRSTAVASGTANVRVGISAPPPSSTVTTGNVAVTQPTAASLNATVVGAGTSSAASGGSLSVNPDSVVDGTTTNSGPITSATTLLTFTNLQGYGYIAFGFSAVGSGGTAVVDTAADGTNYNSSVTFIRLDSTGASAASSTANVTTAMQFVVPVSGQAMRIRLSAYASGTFTAYGTLKRGAVPASPSIAIAGNVSVNGNVASGSADSGNPTKTGGKYNSTLPTFTNGQRGDTQIDAKGQAIATIYDAAGNGRGANVNASNQLLVSIFGSGAAALDAAYSDAVAPTNGLGILGQYNSSPPTIGTTAHSYPLQSDVHGDLRTVQVDGAGNIIDYTQNISINPGPGGRVDVSCSTGNIAAATATCTMPATAGKTTYITGFDITGAGATVGAVVTCTLTNTNSGTHSYTYAAVAGITSSDQPLIKNFQTPLKATATNTAPVLSCPSLGTGNTNMAINMDGYEL